MNFYGLKTKEQDDKVFRNENVKTVELYSLGWVFRTKRWLGEPSGAELEY